MFGLIIGIVIMIIAYDRIAWNKAKLVCDAMPAECGCVVEGDWFYYRATWWTRSGKWQKEF